jgi:hypothetical protein
VHLPINDLRMNKEYAVVGIAQERMKLHRRKKAPHEAGPCDASCP